MKICLLNVKLKINYIPLCDAVSSINGTNTINTHIKTSALILVRTHMISCPSGYHSTSGLDFSIQIVFPLCKNVLINLTHLKLIILEVIC